MTPHSIVVWFSRAFSKARLSGCSSHSGRRTFITRAARFVHKAGGSLRDVQPRYFVAQSRNSIAPVICPAGSRTMSQVRCAISLARSPTFADNKTTVRFRSG